MSNIIMKVSRGHHGAETFCGQKISMIIGQTDRHESPNILGFSGGQNVKQWLMKTIVSYLPSTLQWFILTQMYFTKAERHFRPDCSRDPL